MRRNRCLYLAEGLSYTSITQRLGFLVSSLAIWDRQARVAQCELPCPGQGPLTIEKGADLVLLRLVNRELRRGKAPNEML